jgi:glutamyl-tRNA synthetase
MDKVITRIAPSPTGQMHIGTVRTALFNYLWAKKNGGVFLARIEDTDTSRNRSEWTDLIWSDFAWCGLNPDKKYIQSEHAARHNELLTRLVAEGKAYVSKEPAKDDASREVEVVRLKNPGTVVTFADAVHGEITIDTADLGDFVIARSLTEPLYHFAVVVDDADAGVTHVIRGEDIMSSTARQILIQEALGFARPAYVHLPLILSKDRKKLSKRKDVVSLDDYRKNGFIPEGLINYLALLGWNPGTEEELFTLEELCRRFSLEQIQKSGAIFDDVKLRWFNHEHLKRLSDEEYAARLREFSGADDMDMRIVPLIKERAQTLKEAAEVLASEFEFLKGVSYEPELLLNKGKISAADASKHLRAVSDALEGIEDESFTAARVKDAIFPYADKEGRGAVLWPLRTALSGRDKSPDPFTIAGLIGKRESLERIARALKTL